MKQIVAGCLLLIACHGFALDIETREGRVFTNCVISSSDPLSVTVQHQRGISKVFYSEMTPECAAACGYDSGSAKLFSDRVRAEEQRKLEMAEDRRRRELARIEAAKTNMPVAPKSFTDSKAEAPVIAKIVDQEEDRAGYGHLVLVWPGTARTPVWICLDALSTRSRGAALKRTYTDRVRVLSAPIDASGKVVVQLAPGEYSVIITTNPDRAASKIDSEDFTITAGVTTRVGAIR